MSNSKISVIVPVFNQEKYLEDTVATLTAQTYKNLEIILVDDGSTDNSLKVCNKLSENDDRIVVIHQQNSGVSSARNAGIKHATGEYISFCDGDDTVESDIFEFLYTNLVKDNADISVCGIKMVHPDGSFNQTKPKHILWQSFQDYAKDLFKGSVSISSCAKLYKTEICKNVLFDEELRIYEDKYYCFLTAFNANRITSYDVPKYTYFRRNGSSSIMDFSEKFFDGIKISDKIIDIVKENHPELLNDAYANKLITVLRTYKLMITRNGLKKFKKEAQDIKTYIKTFDKTIAKKYLSKKNYIRYMVAKTNESLFAFMSKHFEKS